MIIDTTINCDIEIVQLLEAAVMESGKSRSALISLLLRRVMKEFRILVRDNRRVQYQKRNSSSKRKKVHMTVQNRDYEFFIDMRKMFKWSVSALVAYGVRKHLTVLLLDLKEDTYDEYDDNYPFNCYFLINDILDGAISWRIYWGKPEKTELLHQQRRN